MRIERARSRTKGLLLYHLPVLLYAGGIIAVSSIRNLPSPQVDGVALDKLAHFAEYALFAFLIFRSVSRWGGISHGIIAPLLSLIFLIAFAALDEFYQQFVPGRDPDLFDIVSDTAGAALVLSYLWLRRRSRMKNSR